MLVEHCYLQHVLVLLAFLCLAGTGTRVNARPLQERNPQGEDRPGFVPEVTSLIASLAGDGWDGLLDAIYGDKEASSALAAATSAIEAGDQGAAENYFSEATAAVGDGWSQATDVVDDNWSSFTSAYDENNSDDGDESWTSILPWTDDTSKTSTPTPWTAASPTSTPSGSSASLPSASQTGAANNNVLISALTGSLVALSIFFLTAA